MAQLATPLHAWEVPAPLSLPQIQEDLRLWVRRVIASLTPPAPLVERRRDHRQAYPQLLRITPVESERLLPSGASQTVVGRELSESGLSFFHPAPLAFRWGVVELEAAREVTVSLLVDLHWCRFARPGWYESGGRFVRVVGSTSVS